MNSDQLCARVKEVGPVYSAIPFIFTASIRDSTLWFAPYPLTVLATAYTNAYV
jgi:hypothetical protein